MDGVSITISDTYTVCHIHDFSEEMKESLRKNFSQICYGKNKATRTTESYTYKSTLKEFLIRYENKTVQTKIGLIGELISHAVIIEVMEDYIPVSAFFNLEERSLKKGYDVMLFKESTNELWVTEVKAGNIHKGKTSNDTVKDLLTSARNDLNKRLNENHVSYWQNAINHAWLAINNNSDYKDTVIELLEGASDKADKSESTSHDDNAFLTSVLFHDINEPFSDVTATTFYDENHNSGVFKAIHVFTIQKSTIEKVVDFLKDEAS